MRDLTVSVVVPTLDEAGQIGALLGVTDADEVIVVDGGSRDGTAGIAARHPRAPRVLEAVGGRAAQCNAGAAAAGGDLLVFLHADSRLPPDGAARLRVAGADPAVVGGNFALRFGDDHGFAAVLGRVYALQRRLGLYYGDSCVWCRATAFAALGGYAERPIMDDYDFVRRLERHGRTTCIPGPAITSDRRWRAMGIARTVFAWTAIRWLYLAGVSPGRLARLYRVVR